MQIDNRTVVSVFLRVEAPILMALALYHSCIRIPSYVECLP